jgi:hypothetical protein
VHQSTASKSRASWLEIDKTVGRVPIRHLVGMWLFAAGRNWPDSDNLVFDNLGKLETLLIIFRSNLEISYMTTREGRQAARASRQNPAIPLGLL